jgi:hypothetical protein
MSVTLATITKNNKSLLMETVGLRLVQKKDGYVPHLVDTIWFAALKQSGGRRWHALIIILTLIFKYFPDNPEKGANK